MGSYEIVRSKMEKTRVLQADAALARYVPKTEPYNSENLQALLQEFQRVYVKPDCGRGGERVIFVGLEEDGGYRVCHEAEEKRLHKRAAAAEFIDRIAAGDPFIVQQGIGLLCIEAVPFDLRVNVQKPYARWEVTAMIAKRMAPGKVVTNYCQGATLVDFGEALLQAGLSRDQAGRLEEVLTGIGGQTAAVLNGPYPGLRELGLDIALDSRAEPWILEVNTQPKYPRGLSKKFDRYRRIIRKKYR